jgi:hypothetical protein
MIYLFWGLLNIALFIFFIVICFKATKHIKEKMGLFASIVFVFGLLSFVGHSSIENNKELNYSQTKTWKFKTSDSLNSKATYFLKVNLEKNFISKYDLMINYTEDIKGGKKIPISASSSTSGFVSGTNWRPMSIIINETSDNNQFNYIVLGVVEWHILGTTIYLQSKEYKGIAIK